MFGGNFHLGSEISGKIVLKSWIFAHKNMVCGFYNKKTRKNRNVPPNVASFSAIFFINTKKCGKINLKLMLISFFIGENLTELKFDKN